MKCAKCCTPITDCRYLSRYDRLGNSLQNTFVCAGCEADAVAVLRSQGERVDVFPANFPAEPNWTMEEIEERARAYRLSRQKQSMEDWGLFETSELEVAR